MIDKFGAPTPQSHNNQCQISNVHLNPGSMTADWVCSGMMAGKGFIRVLLVRLPDLTTGKVHFEGSMQMGQNATPIEYTILSTSVYKGPDCGSVNQSSCPTSNRSRKSLEPQPGSRARRRVPHSFSVILSASAAADAQKPCPERSRVGTLLLETP